MATVDEVIYITALESCSKMEDAMQSAKTDKDKRGVYMRYINLISPRAKPSFNGDRYDVPNGNPYVWSAIGIGEYMYEKLIEFSTTNRIKHAII